MPSRVDRPVRRIVGPLAGSLIGSFVGSLVGSLVRRLARLRWLAVPIAAYLVVTLGLPLAHGAAERAGFARHATWVILGCGALLGLALLGSFLLELARAGLRRLARHPGDSL